MKVGVPEIKQSFYEFCKSQGWEYSFAKESLLKHIDSPEIFDYFFEYPFSEISEYSKRDREKILIEVLLT